MKKHQGGLKHQVYLREKSFKCRDKQQKARESGANMMWKK